ncbi:MAG TPA: MlaD family protein [Solirubrobacteraceae bacterium]|nr:MlaD family protein [Solirubrobacteraceae bacterium]
MRRPALIASALAAAAVVAAGVLVLVGSGSSRGAYLVRAIFDDASFAATGEDVRIAGADVGTVRALGVTRSNQAAVTLAIDNPAFVPFHADATCAIRPQSLIGEEYVDCLPGSAGSPPLPLIRSGPGAGSHYLPVTRTSSPIDFDIVQDTSTMPVRQALAVIIDEFGTGLAARGSDLNAVIHRANPALEQTDRVLAILDAQNRVLAKLATDSDRVLGPLAAVRNRLAGFVREADVTAVAAAARARQISQTFHLLPAYLSALRPLMADLGRLAAQGTPVMSELGASAGALDSELQNLTPFAAAARTALLRLGAAVSQAQPSLVATMPLAARLRSLGAVGRPASANLALLLESLQHTGAIDQLMALLFNGAVAGNGFDSLGHYLRSEPLVSTCTNYATSPVPGCSADFGQAAAAAASATAHSAPVVAGALRAAAVAAARPDPIVASALRAAEPYVQRATGALRGVLGYLLGAG